MPGGRRSGQARDLEAKQVRLAERIGRNYRVSSLEQCSSVDDPALAEAGGNGGNVFADRTCQLVAGAIRDAAEFQITRWNLVALAFLNDIANTDYRTAWPT